MVTMSVFPLFPEAGLPGLNFHWSSAKGHPLMDQNPSRPGCRPDGSLLPWKNIAYSLW